MDRVVFQRVVEMLFYIFLPPVAFFTAGRFELIFPAFLMGLGFVIGSHTLWAVLTEFPPAHRTYRLLLLDSIMDSKWFVIMLILITAASYHYELGSSLTSSLSFWLVGFLVGKLKNRIIDYQYYIWIRKHFGYEEEEDDD